ncbi:MAG: anthranilate phosphoribosyltransferase [bacterium]|nr:anthranilate phosphoribosyltransferase [bacterium]
MTQSIPKLSAYDLVSALISEELRDEEREQHFNDLVSQKVTPEILAEGVNALREKMIPVHLSKDAIDTCGTGGSGKKTVNTSTLTAFIVAACGGKVAKHGNRSASGNCGCFDLLDQLQIKTELTPEQEQSIFKELDIAFLFAPIHHPALKYIAPLRKKHGKKSLFNLLGPLCNPAGVQHQMIGTGSQPDAEIIAQSLKQLGSYGSIVVTGHDGLDEVSICADTTVRTVHVDGIKESIFSPEEAGFTLCNISEIEGGSPKENAEVFLSLAKGKGIKALRNLILVNSAHALLLTDLVSSIDDAFTLASETLHSGKVSQLVDQYVQCSNDLS